MNKIMCLNDINIDTPEGLVLFNVVHLVMKIKQTDYSNVDELLKAASKDIQEEKVKVIIPQKKKPCRRAK